MDGVYNVKQTEDIPERCDRQARVREQMEQLPTRYRIRLILRHLQEIVYEEMANILTMPVGTLKTPLLRVRHLLKERLLAQCPGVPKSWKRHDFLTLSNVMTCLKLIMTIQAV